MAEFSYIYTLDGSAAFVKDATARSGMCEYIKGTHIGTTNLWTGFSSDTELRDGKQILFFLPYSSTSFPTLDITFSNGNSTGPKDILKNGTHAVEESFPARSVIRLTWIDVNDAWSIDTAANDTVVSYDELSDRPMIENVTLSGNASFEDLGLQAISDAEIDAILSL